MQPHEHQWFPCSISQSARRSTWTTLVLLIVRRDLCCWSCHIKYCFLPFFHSNRAVALLLGQSQYGGNIDTQFTNQCSDYVFERSTCTNNISDMTWTHYYLKKEERVLRGCGAQTHNGFYGSCKAVGVCQGLAGRCISESAWMWLWHVWGEQARAELRHNGWRNEISIGQCSTDILAPPV